MELLVIARFATLCFCLSTLINPCSSRQLHLLSSPEKGRPLEQLLTQPPRMQTPMKLLKVNDNKHISHAVGRENNGVSVKQYKGPDHTPTSDTSRAHSEKYKKAKRREKARLLMDMLQILRMDYARVRRRRPIHNKGVPAAP